VFGHGFGGFGLGFLIALLIAIWVASDANKRGMNGVLWAIGVFFLCIVFLPIYLIVRKPLLAQQPGVYPPPGSPPPYNPPPSGTPGHFCSNCGAAVQPGVKFCPNCGKPV
jgi:hypothetical protein